MVQGRASVVARLRWPDLVDVSRCARDRVDEGCMDTLTDRVRAELARRRRAALDERTRHALEAILRYTLLVRRSSERIASDRIRPIR
jgi:hypothetical protein